MIATELFSEERALPSYVTNSKLEERLNQNQMYTLNKKYLLRNKDGEIIGVEILKASRFSKSFESAKFEK